jgi:hypothetical protein
MEKLTGLHSACPTEGTTSKAVTQTQMTPLLTLNRDAEIAKLHERIRHLQQQQMNTVAVAGTTANSCADDPDDAKMPAIDSTTVRTPHSAPNNCTFVDALFLNDHNTTTSETAFVSLATNIADPLVPVAAAAPDSSIAPIGVHIASPTV